MTFEMASRVLLLLTCWQTLHRCAFSLQPRRENTKAASTTSTCSGGALVKWARSPEGESPLFSVIHPYSSLIIAS